MPTPQFSMVLVDILNAGVHAANLVGVASYVSVSACLNTLLGESAFDQPVGLKEM